MGSDEGSTIGFGRIAAVIGAVLLLGFVGVGILGTQVSGILSTVGSSVNSGGSGGGEVEPGGGDTSGDGSGGSGGEPADGSGGNGAAGGSDGGGGPQLAVYTLDRPELLIIKTGTIAIQVGSIDAAVASATNVIDGLGGYASASDRDGAGDDAHASITYRVPVDRWEDALTAMRGLGERVLTERSGTEDVTGQVLDLGARITNLSVTERALQSIMDRAEVIKDVLTVQAELTKVRGEIEQLATQKAHLQEQAAMSTLTVTLALRPNPVLVSQEQFNPGVEVEEATASLVGVLQALATAGIWFAIAWLPILLGLSFIGGIGLLVGRRLYRAVGGNGGTPVGAAPEAGA